MKDPSFYGKATYLGELSASPRTDYCKRDFALQSPEQKAFSAIWELDSQVCNGGFEGYFGNGAAMAAYAPTALRAIGAPLCAAVVEEALALIPPGLPADLWERWEAVHSLPKAVMQQFESLNKRYGAGPEQVISLLFSFVASHPEVFGPTPTEPELPTMPKSTPGEGEAFLRSVMDLMQGGPEALLKWCGGGVRLEDFPPEQQRVFTDLAQQLSQEAEKLKGQNPKRRDNSVGEDDGRDEKS
jgi:hypothetical protein